MVKQILVGIDFSEHSRQALAKAVDWGRALGVPVTAVHVVELPSVASHSMYASMGDPAWFHEVKPKAGLLMTKWLEPYPEVRSLILTGVPPEELMGAADPDTLIVLGQIGHSALEHLLFGSTAAKVVRHAPCDVLVVRTEGAG